MKRLVVWLFASAAAIVVAAVLVAWLGLRASLPLLDGELIVEGLVSTAVIEKDADGIVTLRASSREDLAFATGFAHAQDRYFQMDLIRRQAAGELSELFGERAIEADKRLRFHRFRARASELLQAIPQGERELLVSYANGVNAGLAGLGARPFEYYLLGTRPEPWLLEDSLLVVYAMYMMLNDARAIKDVRRGLAYRALPTQLYDWIYPQGTSWDAPLMGEARTSPPIPGPEVYSLRSVSDTAPPAEEAGRMPLRGSNNWAVSGALTNDGRAIVSNDMHLGLNAPNIWYQVRLVVDGPASRQLSGVSLPGTPFVVAGSNSRIAWGFTNSYGDWSDAVLLRPGSEPGMYQTPDGDRKFERFAETIIVKDGDPVTLTVRETIWGPVLRDIEYPDGDIAVSWVAHKPGSINLRLVELEMADSVSAALDVANRAAIPPQNFVVGDAGGNIAWTIAGRIPRRADFDAMRPADWSDEHGWQGWFEPAEYPRIVNPGNGRIWTANARVADAEALQVVGDGGYELGARARQIRDSLLAQDTFEPEDMLAIQYDDRAIFLARWRELLLDVLDTDAARVDPSLVEYRGEVQDWIPRAVPESVGYRLVRAFRLEVEQRLFHALMAPARNAYGDDIRLRRSNQFEGALWAAVTEKPAHLLPADYDSWEEFLLAAVGENIRYLQENFDGPLSERTWGELNTASIRHPLSTAIPVFGDLLDMPREGLSGDLDMPKAQTPDFGASQRFSVAPGNEANSLMHMPTGQSGHPLSEFYGKGHEDWVQGKPSPFLPGPPQHTLTLSPGTG